MDALFSQISSQPFHDLWRLLSLSPDRLGPALSVLAAIVVFGELVRVALGTELTESAVAHVLVCLLTFPIPSILLSVVLVHAASSHPGRGFVNLVFALGLYVVWYLTGQATRLVRPISEGADVGFMTVGALITFPVGLVSALVFRA
jgi:ABC-type antimicrobial peptide transport system permease subunit